MGLMPLASALTSTILIACIGHIRRRQVENLHGEIQGLVEVIPASLVVVVVIASDADVYEAIFYIPT